MYVVPLKTAIVEALRATFDDAYPIEQLRPGSSSGGVWVSIDYPAEPVNYPGIWVQYDPSAPVQTAGIDHREVVLDEGGRQREVRRWRFAGQVHLTVGALSTWERDLLVDELSRVLASGMGSAPRGRFRAALESSDLLGVRGQWDRHVIGAEAASPGTPWGTDEVIAERTVDLDVIGEYVAAPDADEEGGLVPLSRVVVYQVPQGQPYPPEAQGDGWV